MLKYFVNQNENILFRTARNNLQFYYFQHNCTKQEYQTVKTAYISCPSCTNWTHLNGAQDLNSEILSPCKIQTYINSPPYFLQTSPIQIIHPNVDGSNMSNMRYWFKVIPHISCCNHYIQLMNRVLKRKFFQVEKVRHESWDRWLWSMTVILSAIQDYSSKVWLQVL